MTDDDGSTEPSPPTAPRSPDGYREHGPPLVLVHGGSATARSPGRPLLPHLTDRFTCYLPSTRGRGLSADNPDHSPPRLEEDVTAFVDSIGEPVCLVGWSGSGAWVLGAAARSDSVAAVAVYEPGVIPVMGEDDLARTFGATMEQVGAAAADGRLVDAVRAFAPWICTDDEIAALEADGLLRRWAGGSRRCSGSSSRTRRTRGLGRPTPRRSGRITAPVLLLRGEQTRLGTFFADAAQLHRPARRRRARPGAAGRRSLCAAARTGVRRRGADHLLRVRPYVTQIGRDHGQQHPSRNLVF